VLSKTQRRANVRVLFPAGVLRAPAGLSKGEVPGVETGLSPAIPRISFPSRSAGNLFGDTIAPIEGFEMVQPSHKQRHSWHDKWTVLRALPLGVFLPMSLFFGSVGPDDFAKNYGNWARKWGLTDWADWLAEHATGPRVFWSVMLISAVYLAIAFGLPFLIKHTKRSVATVVVPLCVALIVVVAAVGQYAISDRQSADEFPLNRDLAKRLGEELDAVPKSERFPVTISCPDSAGLYANKMAAEFQRHDWVAKPSCVFLIVSTSTGMGFAISADVSAGKMQINQKGEKLMAMLDAAGVEYGKAVFDEVTGDNYWFIVALPPVKR
jgi:hypothetical protein